MEHFNVAMIVIGVIIQTIVLALAIVTSHIKTRERITTLETHRIHVAEKLVELRGDHDRLVVQVSGISRHVAHLETLHRMCPVINVAHRDPPEGDS